jgi:hypothetical protein
VFVLDRHNLECGQTRGSASVSASACRQLSQTWYGDLHGLDAAWIAW